MSASATKPGASAQVAFPSRLVPGLRLPTRKKAASVAADGSPWVASDDRSTKSVASSRWARLEKAILPSPVGQTEAPLLFLRVLTDYILIGISFTAVVSLSGPSRIAPKAWPEAVGIALLFAASFTLLGFSEQLYHSDRSQASQGEAWIVFKVGGQCIVLLAVALGLLRTSPYVVIVGGFISCLSLGGWRQWRKHRTRRASSDRNVLIVGAGFMGSQIARSLKRDTSGQWIVKGCLDTRGRFDCNILGRPEDLIRIARREFIDEVILTISPSDEIAQRVVREARQNHIDLKVVPDLLGNDPSAVRLERLGDVPVLSLFEERIPTLSLLCKRALDVAASGVALVAVAPLLALIAAAIRLESPGPALYCAPRLGRKGRQFPCFKFRTMVANAPDLKDELRGRNERNGAFFKLSNDPRITRVGRFLRRYSLDELPQLWNVLRGEMSLVGPRPHPVDDFERYDLEDWQRLEVLPGLTGLWQVTARSDPSFERGMALDREYIANWNLGLDLKILFRTIGVVLRGEGA